MNHLKQRNMGYFEHMFGALDFVGFCILSAFKVTLHAVIPAMYDDVAAEMQTHIREVLKDQGIER
jgi:hypothetical protein